MKIIFIIITLLTFSIELASPLIGVRWNKYSRNFESIPGFVTYEEERAKIILESRLLEKHNFNGEPVNVTYYEDTGFFEYYDNDTKVAGICGDMWTLLSDYLNFTLVLAKSTVPSIGVTNPNGTYTGILEYARLNKMDVIPKMSVYITRIKAVEFSHVMWMSSLRVFAYGQWHGDRTWMLNLLNTQVWILILVILIMFSVASIVTQRISVRHEGRELLAENFFSHFFYSFATMCNQTGSSNDFTGSRSNTLNLTVAIFAFLTLTAFNSRLIYNLARESFEAPFNDLESLYKMTKFHVVVLKGTSANIAFDSVYAMPIFNRIKTGGRLTVVSEIDDLYRKVCDYPNKYVLFDSEDSVAARGMRKCVLDPVGIYYYLTPVAAAFSRRLIYRKTINIGILKLRQFGLFDAIKKRYMTTIKRKDESRQIDSLAIDLDRVSLIFGILCFGMIASVVICIVENIVFAVKQRKIATRASIRKIAIVRQLNQTNAILKHRGRPRG